MATYTGETTDDFNHFHYYEVDENGNGWALTVQAHNNPNVAHKHAITDWVVKNAQTDCYPNCEEQFGVAGSPSHSHQLKDVSNSLAEIYKIHMNEYKRMYSTSNPIKQARSISGVEDVFDEENTEQTPTSGTGMSRAPMPRTGY